MEIRGNIYEVILTLLDRVECLLDDPQKKERYGKLYTYAVFRRFSTSYFMFINHFAQEMGCGDYDFLDEDFGCVVGCALDKGIIVEEDVDNFYIMNSQYDAIQVYRSYFARNEDSWLEDIPMRVTFMKTLVHSWMQYNQNEQP